MSGAHSFALQPELVPPVAPETAFEPETPITRLREQAGDFLSSMGGFFLNNRAGRVALVATALTGAASSTACGEQTSDSGTQVVQERPCQAFPSVEQRNEGNASYQAVRFELNVQDETFEEGPGEVWSVLSLHIVDDAYEGGRYNKQKLRKDSQISMDVGTLQAAQKIELFAVRFDEHTFDVNRVGLSGYDDDFRNYAAVEPLPCGEVVIGTNGSVQVVAPGGQMESTEDGHGGGTEATEQPPATASPAQTSEQVPGNAEPFPFNELEDGAICSAAAPELAGNNYRFAIRAYGDRAPAAGELLYAYVNVLKFGPPFSDSFYLVPLNENLEAVVEVPSSVIAEADDVAAHVGQFDPANDPGTEPIVNDDETLNAGQYRSPTEDAMRAGLCEGWSVLDDGTLYSYTDK